MSDTPKKSLPADNLTKTTELTDQELDNVTGGSLAGLGLEMSESAPAPAPHESVHPSGGSRGGLRITHSGTRGGIRVK